MLYWDKSTNTDARGRAGALQVPVSLTFELYGAPGDLPNCFEQFNPSSVKVEEILAQFHPIYPAAMRWLVETEGDRYSI